MDLKLVNIFIYALLKWKSTTMKKHCFFIVFIVALINVFGPVKTKDRRLIRLRGSVLEIRHITHFKVLNLSCSFHSHRFFALDRLKIIKKIQLSKKGIKYCLYHTVTIISAAESNVKLILTQSIILTP